MSGAYCAGKAYVPAFESLQCLSRNYSTLKTNDEIKRSLVECVGADVLGLYPQKCPREILNDVVMRFYPNETAIKAAFIKDVLLEGRSHVTIFELPVGTSRADLCKINGHSTAFEIKTDLDDLQRLNRQLADYARVFENVYLICSKRRLERLLENISEEYGVYSYRFYRGKYVFKRERKSICINRIEPKTQLSLMTKSALMEYGTLSAELSKDDMVQIILGTHASDDINRFFKRYLKQKYAAQWEFLKQHLDAIFEIDYQWFFKNSIGPELIY